MRQNIWGRWASVLVLFFSLSATAAPSVPQGLSFVDMQGRPADFQNHIGQGNWLVVEIWATHCEICKRNAHHMVEFQGKYGGRGVEVIGIAADGKLNPNGVEAHRQTHHLNFPTLLDDAVDSAAFVEHYLGKPWIGATPTFMLFDPEGNLQGFNYGPVRVTALETLIRNLGGVIG